MGPHEDPRASILGHAGRSRTKEHPTGMCSWLWEGALETRQELLTPA